MSVYIQPGERGDAGMEHKLKIHGARMDGDADAEGSEIDDGEA